MVWNKYSLVPLFSGVYSLQNGVATAWGKES